MGYCNIGRHVVVLTQSRYMQLFEVVGRDRDAVWRISARFSDPRGCEADRVVVKLLEHYNRIDPAGFEVNWARFDFRNDDAREAAEDVLSAYCELYGHSCVFQKGWVGTDHRLPNASWTLEPSQGSVIELRHTVEPRRWWWRIRNGMEDRVIVLNLEVAKVTRITGSVDGFCLICGDLAISFGKDIQIGGFVPEVHQDMGSSEKL